VYDLDLFLVGEEARAGGHRGSRAATAPTCARRSMPPCSLAGFEGARRLVPEESSYRQPVVVARAPG